MTTITIEDQISYRNKNPETSQLKIIFSKLLVFTDIH